MRFERSTLVLSGLLITILGVWGALIPFVGPYFDYSFGANSTWQYSVDRLWLCILPGAVALIGGLLMASPRPFLRARGTTLALTAGVWFIVGPPLSLIWEHHAGPIGAPLFGHTRQALELVGYFYGLGALLVALAAYATAARAFARQHVVGEAIAADAARQPKRRRRWGTREPRQPHPAA
jgi:hypothetical protein